MSNTANDQSRPGYLKIGVARSRAADAMGHPQLGLGKLPGDIRFRLFGKTIFLPFASTVLLSLLLFIVLRLIR